MRTSTVFAVGLWVGSLLVAGTVAAQDWPQWRGPDRDGRASGFEAPQRWPAQLTRQWRVEIGDGVATPALVGDRLYVFARQGGEEVVQALDAASGQPIWDDKYEAASPRGGAGRFPGPRSSPTVAEGKLITLGAAGTLTCYDAASGEVAWRKNEFGGAVPMFYLASSPIVVDGLCIAQLGGSRDGGILAYDLNSGEERWRWTKDGPAYGSPVLVEVEGKNVIITPTENYLVALDAADGKSLWEIRYSQGRYNSATPIVDGQTLVIAGPGTGMTAFRLSMRDGALQEEKLWGPNTDNNLQFNTPVLKDGKLFGLSNNDQLFCINLRSGQTAWSAPAAAPAGRDGDADREGQAAGLNPAGQTIFAQPQPPQGRERPGRGGRQGEGGRQGGGGRARGGRGGGGGYGSIVDAGPVLLALTPLADLIVFEPSEDSYTEVARYKVADGGTYAYPVPAGNGIYIKDQDAISLWKVE